MIRALIALESRGQRAQLTVFRLLLQAGPLGLAASEIARAVELRANMLPLQLGILLGAGFLSARRDRPSIHYAANMAGVRALMARLLQECCGGSLATCAPVLDRIRCPCSGYEHDQNPLQRAVFMHRQFRAFDLG